MYVCMNVWKYVCMYVCVNVCMYAIHLGETQVRDVMVVGFDSRLLLLIGLGDGHLLTYHIHTSVAVSLEDIEHQTTENQKLGQVVDQSKFLELALSDKRKCVLGTNKSTYIHTYIETYTFTNIYTYIIHTYIFT